MAFDSNSMGSEILLGGRVDEPVNDSAKVVVAAEDVGMNCEPKHVYEGKAKCECCINWVEEKPELKDPIESEKTAGYALLIRNKVSHGTDGRKAMEIHSIVVQSPLLKRFLGTVLENYPGVTPTLDRLTLSAPFAPFIHRWDRLEKGAEEEQDELTKSHLNLLLSILNTELSDTRSAMKDFVAHKVITFEHLWTIFVPGQIVFTMMDDQECAFLLKTASYEQTQSGKIFRLQCSFVDWNGEKYGKDIAYLGLRDYSGTQAIADLKVFPLQYHPQKEEIKMKILARAKRFQELASVLYQSYEGVAYERKPYEPPPRNIKKHYIEGRIVIDASGFARFCVGVEINLGPLDETPIAAKIEPDHNHHLHRSLPPGPPPLLGTPQFYNVPHPRRIKRRPNFLEPPPPADETNETVELTEEQQLICRHLIRGFSLKIKKWLDFHINDINEIKWNDTAFESLVIPAPHKKLLMALSKSQNNSQANFDDVIEGKGKGMVMLLSGPPGVGKTLTAESVAETMRVPLYAISAGDLGLHPEEVQERLSRCFQIVTSWNAVLLLDEADVFMEQRSVHDLVRNELVSIFLQNLEYYEGTMFLTTNRVETFDPAFQSRVHVAIQYNDLEAASRRQVWVNLLRRLPDANHQIDDQALNNFASIEMNGRQIKNLIKAAGLIAADDGSPMKTEHVKIVLRIMYPSHNAGPMRTTYEDDDDMQIMQPS